MKREEKVTVLRHPLRRYSLERLVRRVSHQSQMDRIIKSMSKPKKITSKNTIDKEESLEIQKGPPLRQKGIMKRIINNSTWNQLIQRQYQRQKSSSTKKERKQEASPISIKHNESERYQRPVKVQKQFIRLRLNPLKIRHKTQPSRCHEWMFFDRKHNASEKKSHTSSVTQVAPSPSLTYSCFKSKKINWHKGPSPAFYR